MEDKSRQISERLIEYGVRIIRIVTRLNKKPGDTDIITTVSCIIKALCNVFSLSLPLDGSPSDLFGVVQERFRTSRNDNIGLEMEFRFAKSIITAKSKQR